MCVSVKLRGVGWVCGMVGLVGMVGVLHVFVNRTKTCSLSLSLNESAGSGSSILFFEILKHCVYTFLCV